nr:otolin-1-like [Salvelinus alpinus]
MLHVCQCCLSEKGPRGRGDPRAGRREGTSRFTWREGVVGLMGTCGLDRMAGATGLEGDKGEKGDQGNMGMPGTLGLLGRQGEKGLQYSLDFIRVMCSTTSIME